MEDLIGSLSAIAFGAGITAALASLTTIIRLFLDRRKSPAQPSINDIETRLSRELDRLRAAEAELSEITERVAKLSQEAVHPKDA